MDFYQLFQNDSNYMTPHFDPDEVEDKRGDDDFILITKPRSYLKDWVSMELKFSMEGSLPVIPTISRWRNYLVMQEHAYSNLKSLLDAYGEFLPCTHHGSRFYLFNPLTIAEDLQGIEPGSVSRINNLLSGIQFSEQNLQGIPVFRTKESYVSIYCSDIFRKAVEEADLEGLIFSTNLTHY